MIQSGPKEIVFRAAGHQNAEGSAANAGGPDKTRTCGMQVLSARRMPVASSLLPLSDAGSAADLVEAGASATLMGTTLASLLPVHDGKDFNGGGECQIKGVVGIEDPFAGASTKTPSSILT